MRIPISRSEPHLYLCLATISGLAIMGILSAPYVSSDAVAHSSMSCILLIMFFLLTAALRKLPLKFAVLLFIAAIPFDPDATVGFLPKLSALDYFSAAAGLAMLWREFKLSLIRKIIKSFPPFSFLFWILFFVYAAVAAKLLHGQLRGTLRWGEFLFCYVLAQLALQENADSNYAFTVHVAKLLSVMAAFISLMAIFQFSRAEGSATSAYATFGQRNVMAAFLSLCLPSCSAVIPGISPRWILLRKVASFLALCSFILSYSRGAWIGLAFGICAVMWGLRHSHNFRLDKIKDAIFIILIIIGPLAVFLIVRNPERPLFSFSERPLYWQATGHVLRAHPWVGLGPGNYFDRLPDYLHGQGLEIWKYEKSQKSHIEFWQHLHSLYFQILVEYGFIGFFLWAGGLGFMLLRSLRTTFERDHLLLPFFMISLIAYLTHNLVDMLAVNSLDLLFVMLLAFTSQSFQGPNNTAL